MAHSRLIHLFLVSWMLMDPGIALSHIIFREFAEKPWLDSWWFMVLGFMRRLSLLPEGSLHLDILQDNIADARQPLVCANWAAGCMRMFMWHRDQKSVCHCLIALLQRAQT